MSQTNSFLFNGGGEGYSVFQIDSIIYSFGPTVDSDSLTIGSIVKITQTGNVIEQLKLRSPLDTVMVNIGRSGGVYFDTNEDQFYIPFTDGDNEFTTEGYLWRNSIIKMNLTGDTTFIWHQDIDNHKYVFYQVIKKGDFYYSCGQTTPDSIQFFDPDGAHGFLMKMDTLGNQIWVRHYANSWKIDYMDRAENGEFVLGSSDFDPFGPEGTQNVVIKTDTVGIEKWQMEFGGDLDQVYTPVEFSNDEHILAIGSNWNQWTSIFPLRIIKIVDEGSFGSVILDQEYYHSSDLFLIAYSSLEDASGNLYTAGVIKKEIFENEFDNFGYLMKCNSELDSTWLRSYTYYADSDNWHFIRDINFAEDGGFVMTGSAEEGSNSTGVPFLDHIWTLKVDSFGCLEPGCQLIDGLEEIVFGLENSMELFPNPASDVLHIAWSEAADISRASMSAQRLLVFNAMGQLVVEEDISGTSTGSVSEAITIEVSNLPGGLYTLHWMSGNSWYDSVKFIKEYFE